MISREDFRSGPGPGQSQSKLLLFAKFSNWINRFFVHGRRVTLVFLHFVTRPAAPRLEFVCTEHSFVAAEQMLE
jgi:hypothetical protein